MSRRSFGIALTVALAPLSFFSLALSTPRVAHADEPAHEGSAAAQEHYSAGRESYRAGLYGRALEEFERSLALAPSPNTRLYLARTLRELGRWSEAAENYRLTIKEAGDRGGRYVATRDAADLELRDVQVRIERGDPSKIDHATGAPVVAPADKSGEPNKPVTPPPRDETGPAAPPPSSSSGRGPTTLTWASGGVAVVGLASFALFYGLAGGRYGYLEDNCARVRTADCDSARTTGKTEEVVGYVSLGVAAAAATVAIVSLLVHPTSTSAAAARARVMEPWRLRF